MTITHIVSRPDHVTDVAEHLARLEHARQRQLDALPSTNLDVVAAAHRASVGRILEEVRTARHRHATGEYGVCTGCSTAIAAERLELRPWALQCTQCADRAGHWA